MSNRSVRIGAASAFTLAAGVVSITGSARADKPAQDTAAASGTATVTATATVPSTAKADVNVNVTAAPEWDETDVTEKDGHRYYFVGARYRGYYIPNAFINIFVSGGASVFTNSGGVELDIRKDGFSLIPNLSYTEYSSGDMLFLQHGTSDTDPGNWSLVNSGLKVMYAGVDLLWSIHLHKNIDFEIGMGFALGVVFGNLEDNWVTNQGVTANSTYVNASGQTVPALNGGSYVPGYKGYFIPCQNVNSGMGCAPTDHQNATVNKVGGYQEPHGFNPVPTIVANISVPQIGLRIKPVKSFVARVGGGFNIPNGVWFGISGDYGLEDLLDKK
jgi:hypothetical protein